MIETMPIPAYRNPGLGCQLGRQLSQAQSAGPPVIEGPLGSHGSVKSDQAEAYKTIEKPVTGVSYVFLSDIDHQMLEEAMRVLGYLVAVRKRPAIHLVVCGGSALIALNLVARTTKDVKVLNALGHGGPDE